MLWISSKFYWIWSLYSETKNINLAHSKIKVMRVQPYKGCLKIYFKGRNITKIYLDTYN